MSYYVGVIRLQQLWPVALMFKTNNIHGYLFPEYGRGNPEHRVWDIGSNEDDTFTIFLVKVAQVLSILRMKGSIEGQHNPPHQHTHTLVQ